MTTTTHYGWTKPTVGADLDAWGTELNTDLDSIDTTMFGKPDKANNLSDLSNLSTARTNLGVPTGTSGAVLGFLNGVNTISGACTYTALQTFDGHAASTASVLVENTSGGTTGTFRMGVATGASSLITGSAQNDVALYTSNPIDLSLDGGTTLHAQFNTTNFLWNLKHAFSATAAHGTRGSLYPLAALTDAATVTWDVNAAQTATLTINGNRTLALPTNLQAGESYALKVIQGAGGNHTLGYAAGYFAAGGVKPVLSTAAAAEDVITFASFDGVNVWILGIAKAFA